MSFKRPSRRQVSLASGENLREFQGLPTILQEAFRVTDPAGGGALFPRVPKPGPSDWLANHKERGQTWKSYQRRSFRPCPHGHVDTLEIVPVGDFDQDDSPSLEILAEFMTIFFGFNCRITKPVTLKSVAKSGLVDDEQLLCSDAMAFLRNRRPPRDVFAQIAVTMQDLTPGEGWNFVYGQASLMNGVGVFSFARYSANFWRSGAACPLTPAEQNAMLQRSCKTMAHEVSHILGLRHCIYFHCIMNGNNGDENPPLKLCPVCLRKAHDSCKMNIVRRYMALADFYKKHLWDEPYNFATARYDALAKSITEMENQSMDKADIQGIGTSRDAAPENYGRRRGACIQLYPSSSESKKMNSSDVTGTSEKSQKNLKHYVDKSTTTTTKPVRVIAKNGLILRAGPGKSSEIVDTVEFEDEVFVSSDSPNMLRTPSGTLRVELKSPHGKHTLGWASAISKRGKVLLNIGQELE